MKNIMDIKTNDKENNQACLKCGIKKPKHEFYKSHHFCNDCNNVIQKKSKNSLTTEIYRYLSKKSGDESLCFTKGEFGEWVHSDEYFDKFYIEWVYSNFNRKLRPCCTKIDDNKPYNLDNLHLTINAYRKYKPYVVNTDMEPAPEKTSNYKNVFQRITDSIMMILYPGIIK